MAIAITGRLSTGARRESQIFWGMTTCGSVTMEGCGGKTIHGFGVIKVTKEELIVVEKG